MRFRRIGCLAAVLLTFFVSSALAHTVNPPKINPFFPTETGTVVPAESASEPAAEPAAGPASEPYELPAWTSAGEPAEGTEAAGEPSRITITYQMIATQTDLEPATPTNLGPATPTDLPTELLRLHQINIGCADAYLLTLGDIVILVDCGTDSTVPIAQSVHNIPLFEYLAASGIDHVDYHFVTHWHNDHDYNVNMLGKLYGTENTVVYGNSAALYHELDPLYIGTYKQLVDGDRLTVGALDILCVGPEYFDKIPGDRNRDSLNFIVTYGDVRIMFTGDYIQDSLRKRWPEEIREIDVFSFPHHGIRLHEQSAAVYKIIDPRLILIPGNERGTVRSYAIHDAGAVNSEDAVYLCARDGNVLINTDGKNIWYATEVEPGTLPLGELLPSRLPEWARN